MAVITVASSKGGATKTTITTLVAAELAIQGRQKNMRVTIIDTDPNQHSYALAQHLTDLSVISCVNDDDSLFDVIDEAKKTSTFVLIDLEGIASRTATFAVSASDFVFVPAQPGHNDAKEAAKTIKMIRQTSRAVNRPIKYALLWTRVKAAFRTNTQKDLHGQFSDADVPMFKTALIERQKIADTFTFQCSLENLPVKNKRDQEAISRATDNVKAIVKEMASLMKSGTNNAAQQEKEIEHS